MHDQLQPPLNDEPQSSTVFRQEGSSVQQEWAVLPDGQPAALVPQATPALAAQLLKPAHKPVKAAAAAAALAGENLAPSLLDVLKAAQKAPPRSAEQITSTFVQLAATGKQVARLHTTHPGWRVLAQALKAHAEQEVFTAEQAISIVSAAGLMGAGPATNMVSQRTCSHLTSAVNKRGVTFPASACDGFMQGLSVVVASDEEWGAAAYSFLGPWVYVLQYVDIDTVHGFPAECLGVLELCARYKADPGELTLDEAASLTARVLKQTTASTEEVRLT